MSHKDRKEKERYWKSKNEREVTNGSEYGSTEKIDRVTGVMGKEERDNMKSSVWIHSTRFLWQTPQLDKWLAGRVHCYTLSSSPSSSLYLSLHPPVLDESALVPMTPETELTSCPSGIGEVKRAGETEREVLEFKNDVARQRRSMRKTKVWDNCFTAYCKQKIQNNSSSVG